MCHDYNPFVSALLRRGVGGISLPRAPSRLRRDVGRGYPLFSSLPRFSDKITSIYSKFILVFDMQEDQNNIFLMGGVVDYVDSRRAC